MPLRIPEFEIVPYTKPNPMPYRSYRFYKIGFYTLLAISAALTIKLAETELEPPDSPPPTTTGAPTSTPRHPVTDEKPPTPTPETQPELSSEQLTLHTLKTLTTINHQMSFKVLDYRKEKLSQNIIDLFDLSPQQVETINRSIESTQEKLADERLSRRKVVPTDNGTIEVTFDPFPEEGRKIYDSLVSLLEDTLGPALFDYFTKLTGNSIENDFSYFGAEFSRYTITRQENAASNIPIFEVKRSYDRGESKGSGTSHFSGTQFIDQGGLPEMVKLITPEELLALPITPKPQN